MRGVKDVGMVSYPIQNVYEKHIVADFDLTLNLNPAVVMRSRRITVHAPRSSRQVQSMDNAGCLEKTESVTHSLVYP